MASIATFVGVHSLDWEQDDRDYYAVTIFGIRYVVWEGQEQWGPDGYWYWQCWHLKKVTNRYPEIALTRANRCKSPDVGFRQCDRHFAKQVMKGLKLKHRS